MKCEHFFLRKNLMPRRKKGTQTDSTLNFLSTRKVMVFKLQSINTFHFTVITNYQLEHYLMLGYISTY